MRFFLNSTLLSAAKLYARAVILEYETIFPLGAPYQSNNIDDNDFSQSRQMLFEALALWQSAGGPLVNHIVKFPALPRQSLSLPLSTLMMTRGFNLVLDDEGCARALEVPEYQLNQAIVWLRKNDLSSRDLTILRLDLPVLPFLKTLDECHRFLSGFNVKSETELSSGMAL